MSNNRAIPEGYMTVGELAKRAGTTVRTLQYYDREGVLSPSAASEGGRRLYTDKDIVALHEIQSMKHLGFSLDDIKNRLTALDTPAEVATALTEQAAAIRQKIQSLSQALQAIESLKGEVLQMQSVDFKKYADIIVNLQMKNEYYWMIKHLDDDTLEEFRNRFDQDSGLAMMEKFSCLQQTAIQFEKDKIAPDSEQGLSFAKAFWDMILEFTNGDMSMLPKLMKSASADVPDQDWKEKQDMANAFIEPALEAYFDKMGINPFEGGAT